MPMESIIIKKHFSAGGWKTISFHYVVKKLKAEIIIWMLKVREKKSENEKNLQ